MSSPQCSKTLRSHREQQAQEGEPLNSEDRIVQKRGDSLYINATNFGAKTHGLEKGTEVTVNVFAKGIWIEVAADE